MKTKTIRLNPAEEKAASIFEQKNLLDGEIIDKEAEIRKNYIENCPIEEIQRYIIKTNNVLAISVISEMWDFNVDVVKLLIRHATTEARQAYIANRKFVKALEAEYAKSVQLNELKVYFSRYKKVMDRKSYNICVDVRKINTSLSYSEEKKVAIAHPVKEEYISQEKVHDAPKEKTQKSFGEFGKDGTFYM